MEIKQKVRKFGDIWIPVEYHLGTALCAPVFACLSVCFSVRLSVFQSITMFCYQFPLYGLKKKTKFHDELPIPILYVNASNWNLELHFRTLSPRWIFTMPSNFWVYFDDYQSMSWVLFDRVINLTEFSLREIADMFLEFSYEKGILLDYIIW